MPKLIPSPLFQNMPVKYFLSSYRALIDGRRGIYSLNNLIEKSSVALSDWRIIWNGTCSTLRTSIDLFKIDGKCCISPEIRKQIKEEWNIIKKHKADHAIFWEFLKFERDNISHEYKWSMREIWIKPDGTPRKGLSTLISMIDDDAKPIIQMNDGPFKGRNSLELLQESADWIEYRIFSAIQRAGFDPEADRSIIDFLPRSPLRDTILTGAVQHDKT